MSETPSSMVVVGEGPPLLKECPTTAFDIGRRTYNVQTDVGFIVRYTIDCLIGRPDVVDEQASRLPTALLNLLVDEWHYRVFWPTFEELGLSFRYLVTPVEAFHWNPCLCQYSEEEGKHVVVDESDFSEALAALEPITKDGCSVRFKSIGLHKQHSELKDASLVLENYGMIQAKGIAKPETDPMYRTLEESIVVSLWKRHLDLDNELRVVQSNQEYRGKVMTIRVRMSFEVMEISWDVHLQGSNILLRAFRGSGHAFVFDEARPERNGICVLEARSRTGSSAQSLSPGEEYFFSFFVTHEVPVYQNLSAFDKLFADPQIVRVDTVVADSLRFTIRIPTREEMARVEARFATQKTTPPDPGREKITQAFQTLSTFVEFDESLSDWERHFSAQLDAKEYSEEEKSEKREKLKMIVEALRVGSMP